MTVESSEPKEADEPQEAAEPLNREERRALKRGKKGASVSKQPLAGKKGKVRSQLPNGGVGKHQLPTKNG